MKKQKRSSYEIKKEILEFINDKPLSYVELERKVNTGFKTIKINCEELERFGQVEIEKHTKHSFTGKPFYKIKITEWGKISLKKIINSKDVSI